MNLYVRCVCRLVCPKYNPARTFTHEGTVGLGGAYMCIYPMNSPGMQPAHSSAHFLLGPSLATRVFAVLNFSMSTPQSMQRCMQVWPCMLLPMHAKVTRSLAVQGATS